MLFQCPVAKVTSGFWPFALSRLIARHPTSSFGNGSENRYIMGLTTVCWAIWKARNEACFDKKQLKDPNTVIFSPYLFMRYWAGLFPGTPKSWSAGVGTVMKNAIALLAKKQNNPTEDSHWWGASGSCKRRFYSGGWEGRSREGCCLKQSCNLSMWYVLCGLSFCHSSCLLK
jgi:hypothetical protein